MELQKPDYKRVYRIATEEILIGSNVIFEMPVDIRKHIEIETDIKMFSYEKAREKYGADIINMGSEDAVLSEKNGRYILFYKSHASEHRIRFSLAHEAGHYYLGHELNSKKISKEKYKLQEEEANYFAAQVLMPDIVLWELVRRGADLNSAFLEEWFDVSKPAAAHRLKTLNKQEEFKEYYRNRDYESHLFLKFSGSIDSFVPKRNRYSSYDDYDYEYEEEMQRERDSWNYR